MRHVIDCGFSGMEPSNSVWAGDCRGERRPAYHVLDCIYSKLLLRRW